MKIVLKKVNQDPEVMEIAPNLKVYQNLVGGLIDCMDIENDISIVFDDEGKLKGKDINLIVSKGAWTDFIVGDLFFIGIDKEEGEFVSLTDEQIEYIMDIA